MPDREVLTIEKIPVHLSLNSLSAATCLAYTGRYYFSSLGKHPSRHPLMHQIGHNPDCQAIGICTDGLPVALCFFHFRLDTTRKKSVILHNFMVAPCLRRRGVGSLLAVHLLDGLIDSEMMELEVEVEFPLPNAPANFASPVLRDLMAGKTFTAAGDGLAMLKSRLKQEEKTLSRNILKSFVTHPGFKNRLLRKECFIGAVSEDNGFFEAVSDLSLPSHVVVQSIHTQFHREIEARVGELDLLLVDASVLKDQPELLGNLARGIPELPVVVAGSDAMPESPAVLVCTPVEGIMTALGPYFAHFDLHSGGTPAATIKRNLLHLPEHRALAYYRNRHEGGRVFIVASGPSLSDVEPERLRNEHTIAINDALLRFPKTRYAAVMDSRKLHELHEPLLEVETLFTLRGNSYGVEIDLLGTEGFNLELENGIYSGYTTAYFSLQIALYMGFRDIYYLGLDLGNTSDKSHFFGSRSLQDRDRPEVYAKMRQSFENIADTVAELGAKVYNCSPVSELKCFPYRSLDDALSESPPSRRPAYASLSR